MDLSGRTALVTGAEGAVGHDVAAALAARGAAVIACPVVPGDDPLAFDPGDIASVDRLADRLLALGRPIDIVVAAAEVVATPFAVSAAGFDHQLAYNAVTNAVLASRLSPALCAAEAGRFLILGSVAHHLAEPDPDTLAFDPQGYDPWRAYGMSKTAAGLVALRIFNELMDEAYSTSVVDPTRDGIATILWAATAPEMFARYGYAEGGAASHMVMHPDAPDGYMPWIGDVDLSDRLWTAIEARLGRTLAFAR